MLYSKNRKISAAVILLIYVIDLGIGLLWVCQLSTPNILLLPKNRCCIFVHIC